MTLQSQENMERLWQTIQSARLGTITPSVAAMTCFTWLIDIINGRCPPFYPETKAKMKDQPGDTPGMREFHDRFCGYLMMNSGLSDDKAQDLLIEFTVEYWSLLRTKKWIYRGETMVLPSLGMDRIVSGHGPVYWPHTVPGFGGNSHIFLPLVFSFLSKSLYVMPISERPLTEVHVFSSKTRRDSAPHGSASPRKALSGVDPEAHGFQLDGTGYV